MPDQRSPDKTGDLSHIEDAFCLWRPEIILASGLVVQGVIQRLPVTVADVLTAVARVRELEATLAFYADPSKYRDEDGKPVRVPDFYSELEFGERAHRALTRSEE